MEFSRFVQYWQVKRNSDIHQKNLKTIKPMIDTTNYLYRVKDRNKSLNSSNGYNHRNFEIEMENRALLNKLTKVKTYATQNHTPEQQSLISKRKRSKKNNIFVEFQRGYQNKDLLNKITTMKGSYSARMLANDYKKKQKYMNLICKYPFKGMKPTKTFLKLEQLHQKQKIDQKNKDQTVVYQRLNTNQFQNTAEKKQRRQSPIENQTKILKTRKITLNGMQILVKGFIQKPYLIIQIIQDKSFKQIKLPLLEFLEHYGADYQEVLDSIRFNTKLKQFYLYE